MYTFYVCILSFLLSHQENVFGRKYDRYSIKGRSESDEEWTGRWFPDDPTGNNEKESNVNHDQHGGIPMGVIENCDDGKSHLYVDYNGTRQEYTCFDEESYFLPRPDVHPILEHDRIPRAYSAPHYCMNETINYRHLIPNFGGHRPVWPKYGEYNYVPPQRWLHSIEHGAVVMLYHPCANHNEVNLLKSVVRNCLFRHIITANSNLHPNRPLALLTWGNRLLMSKFDVNIAIRFIAKYANRAPEKTTKDGNYSMGLINPAKRISNDEDNEICKKFMNLSL